MKLDSVYMFMWVGYTTFDHENSLSKVKVYKVKEGTLRSKGLPRCFNIYLCQMDNCGPDVEPMSYWKAWIFSNIL